MINAVARFFATLLFAGALVGAGLLTVIAATSDSEAMRFAGGSMFVLMVAATVLFVAELCRPPARSRRR